jgi:hypothetical protein
MARVEPIEGATGRARRARHLRHVVTEETAEPVVLHDAVVHHVRLWSIAKVALAFWTCVGVILFAATLLLWETLVAMGFVGHVESFIGQLADDKTFHIVPSALFVSVLLFACAFVIAATTMTIVAGSFYNLLAATIGGVRLRVRQATEDD